MPVQSKQLIYQPFESRKIKKHSSLGPFCTDIPVKFYTESIWLCLVSEPMLDFKYKSACNCKLFGMYIQQVIFTLRINEKKRSFKMLQTGNKLLLHQKRLRLHFSV